MTRYKPSRRYLLAGVFACGMALFCGWLAVKWPLAILASALFAVSAALVLSLALRPRIEIREDSLIVGRRRIAWNDIRRVDRTAWISPLVVRLTLFDAGRVWLVYPGDLDSANSLLRNLRRLSRQALIDGIPYHQYHGDVPPSASEKQDFSSPNYRVVSPEDEAEIERLYQRLKTVGHLDTKNPADES
jgi:hypothetical protein